MSPRDRVPRKRPPWFSQAGPPEGWDRGGRARIAGWIRLTWKPAIPVLLSAATALTFILVREPAPVPVPAPQSAAVDGVDLNQVEQTLDDLNMLHQLSPTSSQSL